MTIEARSPWDTHDFKAKTLEGSASGASGSRLGFTCRSCGRKFNHTLGNRRTWAVNNEGVALDDAVTTRWLAENCLRYPAATDDDDRKRLRGHSHA
ncbi:MAG: hypothetical protein ACREQN_10590 [Candidatus Binataceae bacterium]